MIDVVARNFTRTEAQELVPVLTELFSETRRLVEELLARRQDAVSFEVSGSSVVDEDSAFRMQQLGDLLKARLHLVTAMGLEVRRVDGLVDIPAWINGEFGYFCWRYGDERIGPWHAAHEGCTDRRPLEALATVGLH